jgi:hypothetical protein
MERKLHGNTVKGKSKMKEAILFQNRGFPLKEREIRKQFHFRQSNAQDEH